MSRAGQSCILRMKCRARLPTMARDILRNLIIALSGLISVWSSHHPRTEQQRGPCAPPPRPVISAVWQMGAQAWNRNELGRLRSQDTWRCLAPPLI